MVMAVVERIRWGRKKKTRVVVGNRCSSRRAGAAGRARGHPAGEVGASRSRGEVGASPGEVGARSRQQGSSGMGHMRRRGV
jgi:hypothetical protein